jgi:hypothetical protein
MIFNKINSEILKVSSNSQADTSGYIKGTLCCLLIPSIILFITYITENLVEFFIFLFIICLILIVSFFDWLHKRTYSCEFKFDKLNNEFIKVSNSFGREKTLRYNLTNIQEIECIRGGHYYINIVLSFQSIYNNLAIKKVKKVKFFTALNQKQAFEYCNELSNFLGIKILFKESF